MNRVNTVSSTGQPVRISSLNTQSGAPISSIMNAGQNMMNSGNPSNTMPTAYQVRTNFDSMRRSPQVQSNSLSSQLTPLNLNYGGNTTTTTTSIDGIQITKVTPSQCKSCKTFFLTTPIIFRWKSSNSRNQFWRNSWAFK